MTKTNNQKFFRTVLSISLLLNGFAGIYVAKKLYDKHLASVYIPPQKPAYHLNRDELFVALPKDSNSIIFFGNSLTQYFEWQEFFPTKKIKNRGIHGDYIEGLLNRLTPIIEAHPKKIFIEIGGNDLDMGYTKEQLLTNYQKLIDTLKLACSTTKIYVESLMPNANSGKIIPTYGAPKRINSDIEDVNTDLRKLAEKAGCTYIELYSRFLLEGEINKRYFISDGVHLSGEGYMVWAKLLKPYIDE